MADIPRYTVDPATGRTVIVYPDGTVVPALGADAYAPMDQGGGGAVPFVEPEAVTSTDADASYQSAPRYTPRHPGYRDTGGYDDYASTRLPNFSDGSSHPLAGGGPRTPGGPAAAASGGFDNRQQVSVPGGASAGPFSVRAAPGPSGQSYGGRADSDGGGGGTSPIYNKLRAKLTGAYSGGSSYGGYSGGYAAPKEPREERMTGRFARGLDPDQAYGLAYRPTAMMPRAMPGLSGASPLYDMLSEMPAYQLGILGKRNFNGSARATANAVGNFYDQAGNMNDLPDFDTLMRNLTNPKKNGGVDQMFNGVRNPASIRKATGYEYEYGKEPLAAGEAAQTYQGLLDATLSLLPTNTAAKYSSAGSALIDKAMLKDMKRPAGKGKSINQFVGRRLFR